jgi:hypothetical protein
MMQKTIPSNSGQYSASNGQLMKTESLKRGIPWAQLRLIVRLAGTTSTSLPLRRITVAPGMYLSCAEADQAFASGRLLSGDRGWSSFRRSTGSQVGFHRFCDGTRFNAGHPAGFAETLDLHLGHTVHLKS